MKKLSITYKTANKLLEDLEKIGILEEITGFFVIDYSGYMSM
jgi:Fic family protein